MEHPQPATPIHVDNTTAVGIVNNTIKRQRLRAMEMRYFWLLDQYAQKNFDIQHHPGQENLGDYPSKHNTGKGHQHVWSYYLHTEESPVYLPRAVTPSTRRGCAEILGNPYYKSVPLPKIQSRAQEHTPSVPRKASKNNFPAMTTAAHASHSQQIRRGTAGAQIEATKLPPTRIQRYTRYGNLLYHFIPRILLT